MRKREPRRKVMVRARIRSGAGWGDVTIHNMSSRGLLATSDSEQRTGGIVEIRRIHHIIVGRVVWQKGNAFGIRTQDKIDIDGIVAARPPAQKPGTDAAGDGVERRIARRTASIADREAQSRRFASRFQFVAVILVIGAVAIFAAQSVSDLLSRPFATIGAHLDSSAPVGQER